MDSSPPIESFLSGKKLDLARLQDQVIEIVYNYVQPNALLYGGTAIWRCYGGGRFSEDIDIYVNKGFGNKFPNFLEKNGLSIIWKDEEFPLRMKIQGDDAQMLFEAKVGTAENTLSQYKKVDGTAMTIYTLSPTELLMRKIEAYNGRRYARDIYDIVQLTNYLDKKDHHVERNLKSFLKNVHKPIDEKILPSLIYMGPKRITFDEIVNYLNAWIR